MSFVQHSRFSSIFLLKLSNPRIFKLLWQPGLLLCFFFLIISFILQILIKSYPFVIIHRYSDSKLLMIGIEVY